MNTDAESLQALHQRIDELMRQHTTLIAQLGQGQQRARQLARSVWRVEEEARRRLARELHDGVGQNLVALMRQIEVVHAALPSTAEECRGGLEQARELVHSTLDDTRSLSRLLRPQILDDLGLAAALHWLARSVIGVSVDLQLPEPFPVLSDETSTVLFRITQEALANLGKHAAAQRVWISLRTSARGVVLQIRDDGRGCDLLAAARAGSEGHSGGLGGMRDRVELFDGVMRLVSAPGEGFQVTVELASHPLGGSSA